MNRLFARIALLAALAVGGCSHSQDKQPPSSADKQMTSMSSTDSTSSAPGVDMHNTVCPVSGDKVESSPLIATYNGKIYHLCCKDCVKPFAQDPAKYASAVAADPSKYGVKP